MERIYADTSGGTIKLGRQGENEAREIIFDISRWTSLYGVGVASLVHKRHGDEHPYPCDIERNGDELVWTVKLADVANDGVGECELIYTVDNIVVKSIIWSTFVAKSLTDELEDAPKPEQSWVDRVIAAASNMKDGEDGFSPKVNITPIEEGYRITIIDVDNSETFDITNGVNGADGADGVSPQCNLTQIDGGYRLSIIDASGVVQSIDIMNGRTGDTGNSGVYLGSGDMPADCNVQIDPDGDVFTLVQETGDSETAVMSQRSVTNELSKTNTEVTKAKSDLHDSTLFAVKNNPILEKTNGYYIHNKTGAITPTTGGTFITEPMELKKGDRLTVRGSLPWGFVSIASKWSADGVFIGSLLTAREGGSVVELDYVATEETEYIRFTGYPVDGYILEISVTIKNDEAIERFKSECLTEYSNPYNGLKAVAFGTSLTYRSQTTGGYLQFLPDLIGMEFDNQGVGSSFFYNNNANQYSILYNVKNYTGYADKRVCLIEGCVNDWYNARALGTYKDVGENTVCGCLYNMIKHIYTQNPNIQIFVILDHYGRLYTQPHNGDTVDMSPHSVRGTYTQYEYYEEIAKCCEYNGVPCIKQYALSSIGELGEQYFMDYIHLNNTIGAKQSAAVIYKEMMKYSPKVF